MPVEPNSRYAAPETPETARIRFRFESGLAGWLYTLGQIQAGLSAVSIVGGLMAAADSGPAPFVGGIAGAVSLVISGSLTAGFSYLVENAARSLTERDRR